jgi:hypothetical protein
VTENTLTNLDTNISINLSVCQPVVGIGENVRHPHVLSFVLAMFPEALPRDHDWHRGLGDEIVTEGAEQNTAVVSIMR